MSTGDLAPHPPLEAAAEPPPTAWRLDSSKEGLSQMNPNFDGISATRAS